MCPCHCALLPRRRRLLSCCSTPLQSADGLPDANGEIKAVTRESVAAAKDGTNGEVSVTGEGFSLLMLVFGAEKMDRRKGVKNIL